MENKQSLWMQIYRIIDLICSIFILPVAVWSFRMYTSFVVMQVEHDALKKENDQLRTDVVTWIANEKTDRTSADDKISIDVRDFRNEYYSDFPKNYLQSINRK